MDQLSGASARLAFFHLLAVYYIQPTAVVCVFVMAALWNSAGHYIFMLLFLSIFYLLLSFFPRLISAVGDWMSTILRHMVWP